MQAIPHTDISLHVVTKNLKVSTKSSNLNIYRI